MGATTFNRYRRRAAAQAGVVAEATSPAPQNANVSELVAPPREGRGSGKQAWVEFAATVPGLVIDENDTRDEIAAKFDALVAENTAKLDAARLEAEDEAAREATGNDEANADNISTATGDPEAVAAKYPADPTATDDSAESDPLAQDSDDEQADNEQSND